MSLKDLFSKISVAKSLTNKSENDIASEVESVNYHEADIIKESRFMPPVDYSKPENFARYGSAKKYYGDAVRNIYTTYPYDGSLYERLKWENSSSYVDLYVLDKRYPRTTGYVNLSYGGWGALNGSIIDGYGLPTNLEYISLYGGPHAKSITPRSQGANKWDPSENRESNLELDLTEGTSIEFWLKKEAFDAAKSPKEVVFDLWNYAQSSSVDYGRFRIDFSGSTAGADPFKVTIMSGTVGFVAASICASTFTTASVMDGTWHHYAFTFKSASAGVTSRFYVDGGLNNEAVLGSVGINKVSGSMAAYIGALRTTPSSSNGATTAPAGSGKLSGSLDEFRYWKTQRSSKDIGRYWFTQVGGGTNTDLANTDLGVYYKFNEGITGVESRDLTILDYSGRVTNGQWTRGATFASAIRNTGSAIVSASAAAFEFRDPVLYPTHSDVQTILTALESTGSAYDHTNNSSMFGMFPSWMQEEDSKGGDELKNLTQIIGTYFDSLHLQIESLSNIKDFAYVSGSDRPNIFSNRLLDSRGLLAPELFLDADILEQLADRSEDKLFSESLTDIKSTIYQNIYNNLIHIYKSKGTEKGFRNLIRCFGIDEEVVKLNLYGNNIEYELRDNTTMAETRTRLIDFNNTDRFSSVVFQNSSSADSNSVSYISGSSDLSKGYAFTLETEVLFPKKFAQTSNLYASQNFTDISASIFGLHTAVDDEPANTTWNPLDRANFQVYAARGEAGDDDARFVLSASAGGCITGSVLTSSLFDQVYDNSKWSLAVRVRPDTYPEMSFVSGTSDTSHNWIVDFYGVQYDADVILNEFNVSGTLLRSAVPDGFVTGSKRVFVGAHATNFTGSVLEKSDVKVAACRYWLDYVSNDAIRAHARDVRNYGALHPYRNAYLFQNGKNNFEVPQLETLALNWDFEQVTGSDASGEFVVADFSSGSTAIQNSRYGVLGNIVAAQHTGRGYGFPASSIKVVDVDYLVSAKQNLPESLYAQDMIKILSTQDDLEFTRESRPITFFFAFEKSMYQAISEEMLNIFGSIVDFNNLIGEPVNKYRPQYKRLGKLRELFFERVGNTPDLDKYIEFYKWFDTSLGKMIEQLVPASADFADGIRIMVENHILARDKYQHKFPTLEMKASDPSGPILTVLPLSPGWKYTHHPVSNLQRVNANWWKNMAQRYPEYSAEASSELNPLSSSVASVNQNRSMILKATESARNRKKSTPYRFTVENSFRKLRTIRSGINYDRKKERDVVYGSAYPAGPLIAGTNLPANVMLAFGKDVEEWQDISDKINPNEKKRLGFGMNIDVNKDTAYETTDGMLVAPFSLYSSSVNTGYNHQVVDRFTGSVELTNLHADVYGPDYEVPMQGTFTERFVGGREHRHVRVNRYDEGKTGPNNLDDPENRPEGFKLLFGLWLGGKFSSGGPATPGALGVVGPQYPDPSSPAVSPPYLYNRPKANFKRGLGAKRPVNIKNIRMTPYNQADIKDAAQDPGTALSGALEHNFIGNYQKNYQIVQSAGRSLNDPFFKDQSFDFALYPETIATRGRFPLSASVSTINTGGDLDYALPSRSGANSNQSIIVNRFNAPGGWDVSSRGYMDPAHEEKSVYNALPWRNRGVIDYGRSGSVPGDPTISGTIHVIDQINKARGLDQLSTLRSGRFGADAAYGSVPQVSYVTVPSWNKMNRNPKRVIKEAPVGAGVFGAGSGVNIGKPATWEALIGGSAPSPGDVKAFSVSAWVRATSSVATTQHFWTFGNGDRKCYLTNGGDGIAESAMVSFYIDGVSNNGTVNSAIDAFTIGEWHHLVCTYDGTDPGGDADATTGSMKIYIDNFLDNEYLPTALNGVQSILSYDCYIGKRQSTTLPDPISGSISNVAIWSRELTAAEVGDLYNGGTVVNIQEKLPTSLEAWYRFNTYAGDTASEIKNQISPVSYSDIITGSAASVTLQAANTPKRFEGDIGRSLGAVSWPTYETNTYDNAYVTHQIPRSDRQYAWITGSLLSTAKVYGYDGLTSYAYFQNNSSMFFDGTDDKIDISNGASDGTPWDALIGGAGDAAKAFSISAWFCARGASDTAAARLISLSYTDRNIYFRESDNKLVFFVQGGIGANAYSDTLNLNQWYHVVAAYSGGSAGTLSLYIDGVLDGTNTADGPVAIDGSISYIGALAHGSNYSWAGNIDEVAIWSAELTAAQAKEVYNSGHAMNLKQHSAAGSLLSWYRMGDGKGDTATLITDQAGNRPGVVAGAVVSDFSVDGSRYDGALHYKLEDQFVSASDFGGFVDGPIGLPSYPTYRFGQSRAAAAAAGNIFFGGNFVGMNFILKDPVTGSENTVGFPLNTEILSTLNGQQRVKLIYPRNDNPGLTQYANRNLEEDGATPFPLGVVYDGTTAGSAPKGGTAQMFNALILHRNGPYGWPTFRQIQAGPHSHPVVRDQRKNNRLTIRTAPALVNNEGRSLNGNSFVSYIDPPVGSEHQVLTHTLIGANKMDIDESGNEIVVNQSTIYNHTFGNKVDYFANVELTNKLNLKLDTDRGDLYFNRLNEILLRDIGDNEHSPFENLEQVNVNYKQRVYPAPKNVGQNRNRRRINYSISNIWNNSRTVRSDSTSVYIPFSKKAVPNQSIWPLDGHSSFQTTASVSINGHGGAGELLNQFSGFGVYGMGTITASCLYAQRGMYGEAPNGQTITVPGNGGSPVIAGLVQPLSVYAGDAEYQAAEQARKKPYLTYDQYCENLRLIGKDYSIVPEFRISEQMDYYLNTKAGDFWADNDSFLDLTGSSIADSSESNFFKVYTNSDFMRLFNVVDEAYDNKPLVNGDIMKKDKLALRCSGLVKFLPYKGFYPAERTLELGRLLSSSYGPFMQCVGYSGGPAATHNDSAYIVDAGSIYDSEAAQSAPAFRAFTEPLMGPGILYNTIKSGVAVSNYLVRRHWDAQWYSAGGIRLYMGVGNRYYTGPDGAATRIGIATTQTAMPGQIATGTEFNEYYGSAGLCGLKPRSLTAGIPQVGGEYYYSKLPFEALLKPKAHMSRPILGELPKNSTEQTYNRFNLGLIFDRGVGSGSISGSYANVAGASAIGLYPNSMNTALWPGSQKDNYELAIDNFVCETTDFFQTPLKNFMSAREDQFKDVKSGSVYSMQATLYRTLERRPIMDYDDAVVSSLGAGYRALLPDTGSFVMYNRPSAFGRPASGSAIAAGEAYPTFVHVVPPYYHGWCKATFLFKPEYDGRPTLDDIFTNSEIYYERSGESTDTGYSTNTAQINIDNSQPRELAMQMSASVNLKEKVTAVIPDTVTATKRWLLQTKFETPMLNFNDVSGSLPKQPTQPTGFATKLSLTRGMWHQYGAIPTGSSGVFISLEETGDRWKTYGTDFSSYNGTVYTDIKSLISVCGFEKGVRKLGTLKDAKVVSEAIVAVPFTTGADGRKKFYRFSKHQRNGAVRILAGQQTQVQVKPDVLKICKAQKDYVFPPTFDFVTTEMGRETIDPFVMFVFPFYKKFTQQDLADMWQNLPPDVTVEQSDPLSRGRDNLQAREMTIQHSLLAEDFFDNDQRQIGEQMRWMVFKVKQRAKSNFNKYRVKDLSDDLSTVPDSIKSPYTYNWPYDYFSLVELVKMDMGIQYASIESDEDPEAAQDVADQAADDAAQGALDLLG